MARVSVIVQVAMANGEWHSNSEIEIAGSPWFIYTYDQQISYTYEPAQTLREDVGFDEINSE